MSQFKSISQSVHKILNCNQNICNLHTTAFHSFYIYDKFEYKPILLCIISS